MAGKDGRSSTWCFIEYPESAPEDWLTLLKMQIIPFAVSPLHVPDDEIKKPHWHVMLAFNSNKTYDQVYEISRLVNGSFPIIPHNPSCMFKYFVHLDNPEKEQFQNGINEICCYNGFDKDKYNGYSQAQLDAIFKEICNFITDHSINEYSTLLEYSLNTDYAISEYFKIIRSNTIFFNSFITSRRHREKVNELDEIRKRLDNVERKR